MKKERRVICTALALVMVLSLAACHKGDENPINTLDPTLEPEQTPMETITDFYEDMDEEKVVDSFLSDEFIQSNFDVTKQSIKNITYDAKSHMFYEGTTRYYKGSAIEAESSASTELSLALRDGNNTVLNSLLLTVLVADNEKDAAHDALYRIISGYLADDVVAKVKDVESKLDSTYYASTDYITESNGLAKIEFRAEPTTIIESVFTEASDADKQMKEMKDAYAAQGAPQEELNKINLDMFGTYSEEEVNYTYYEVGIDFPQRSGFSFTSDVFLSGNDLKAAKNIPCITVEGELLRADFSELKELFDASDATIKTARVASGEDWSNIDIQISTTANSDKSITTCEVTGGSNGHYSIEYKSGYYDTPCEAAEVVKKVALFFGISEEDAQAIFDEHADEIKSLKNTQSKQLEFNGSDTQVSATFNYIEHYGYFVDYVISPNIQ